MVSRARPLGYERRLELVPEGKAVRWVAVRFAGDISATRTPAHQSCRWPRLGREKPHLGAGREALSSMWLCCVPPASSRGRASARTRWQGQRFPGSSSGIPEADRVDLELRDNKLMTGTVRSQKDGRGGGGVRVCLPHSSKFCDVARLHLISIVVGM